MRNLQIDRFVNLQVAPGWLLGPDDAAMKARTKMTGKTRKREKRTHLTGKELKRMRREMKFDPRDMRAILVPVGHDPMSKRTYEDYEADRRGIPAELATRIRELHKQDQEFMATIGDRIDAAEREENQ